MKNPDSWIKLERGNDWGVDYWTLPGQSLTPHRTASVSLGLPLPEGARVHVRWPDGSTSVETIAHRKEHIEISDMGHSYNTTSTLVGFNTSQRGVGVWVPIDEVEVRLGDVQ